MFKELIGLTEAEAHMADLSSQLEPHAAFSHSRFINTYEGWGYIGPNEHYNVQ